MKTSPNSPYRVLCKLLIALAIFAGSNTASAQIIYQYASPAGFETLADDTPTNFTFVVGGGLSVERIGSLGDGLVAETSNITIASTSPFNPPWVAGNRSYFQLAFDTDDGLDGTATYEFIFASPLTTAGYLVFADLDFDEQVNIRAYDESDVLIPFANLTFTQQNGNEPGASSSAYIDWTNFSPGTYSGRLANIVADGLDNPIVTISSNVTISRLVYEFNNNPTNDNSLNNSIRFNFIERTGTPATMQPVPVLPPLALLLMILAVGTVAFLTQRRKA
jgi:hypothetical protein